MVPLLQGVPSGAWHYWVEQPGSGPGCPPDCMCCSTPSHVWHLLVAVGVFAFKWDLQETEERSSELIPVLVIVRSLPWIWWVVSSFGHPDYFTFAGVNDICQSPSHCWSLSKSLCSATNLEIGQTCRQHTELKFSFVYMMFYRQCTMYTCSQFSREGVAVCI